MVDLSYFAGDQFAFYDSARCLYLSIRIEIFINVIQWVTEAGIIGFIDELVLFYDSKTVIDLFRSLASSKYVVTEEDYHDFYIKGVVSEFKAIGLDNIWLVPIDGDWYYDNEVIDFNDGIRLVDIL